MQNGNIIQDLFNNKVEKMKNKKKFNPFYNKVVDYQKRKLSQIVNKTDKDNRGNYSKEYSALSKSKNDIIRKAKNILDGTLTFSEIISYGEISKNARNQWSRTQELSLDSNLRDYTFKDETDEIKAGLYHQTQEFVMDVFNEKTVKRLLDNIFFYGYSKISHDKIQMVIDEEFENYKIGIAKEMAKQSINELKKYLPVEWEEFLTPKLDEALAICDTIKKDPDKFKSEQIQKKIRK